MRHVIVTGGGGFIGSHLCDHLLRRGYAVTAIDNFVTGRKENLRRALRHPHFDLIEASVSRPVPRAEIRFLAAHGLHGLLHFACPAGPAAYERMPFDVLEAHSFGTQYTVELALRYRARYVLASTGGVYGDPLVHPQREGDRGNVNAIGPRACYAEAKRYAEAYVSASVRHRGLNGGIARLFNTYGPRMRPDDGRMVPEFCSRALRGQELPICGDGLQTRSLCYVADIVEGVVRLLESEVVQPVNLGSPDERRVLEVAELIRGMTGGRSALRHGPARPDDPRQRCPDTSRARALLGWEPQVDLRTGLELTLAYFQALEHPVPRVGAGSEAGLPLAPRAA